ncbi:c-type cytochrome [Autumnicola musiva]|uniref:Cytochrome c n=1 Tax=Autumnicola musiva TaxID=3075589 RepID=A0ABU3DA92_9FLAO|nr:cytochrome c [Zunongwangia sp. F117]MDT0678457.1 cytochrome c [Zunongwangia sp. F117]
MKYLLKSLFLLGLALLVSCGGKEDKKEKEEIQLGNYEKKVVVKPDANPPEADLIDMSNKGIGPVKNLELSDNIDQAMADKGKAVFDSKCMACHKPHKKFIGPAPAGVLDRRSPEWVMNMILNPNEMIMKDPIAKQLLIEHNGSPMANQGLTEEEARQILEYFRTLEK